MSLKLLELQLKLAKIWSKLLKAETKRNSEKVAKLESKLIKTELKIKELKLNKSIDNI